MPTRKQDPETAQFRQDAFASSPDYERGIMGNLVAERCARFPDAEDVTVYWWLQRISWRAGGLVAFAADFLDAYRDRIGTASMLRYGMAPGQTYTRDQVRMIRTEIPDPLVDLEFPLKGEEPTSIVDYLDLPKSSTNDGRQGHPNSYPASVFQNRCHITHQGFAELLARSLVDPASRPLRCNLWNFPELWDCLLEYRKREIDQAASAIVETEVTKKVFEELDYGLEARTFILIEGLEGVGKTAAAFNWCARHPGQAVYIRLEAGADEQTLYRSIARQVGTSCSYGRKAKEMRARLQDALQAGQLMLVLDEAHFLWPTSARSERSVPKHVEWVRTAFVDYGVPVALISTPQFFDQACKRFLKSGWNSRQVRRRLDRITQLPETLKGSDAEAVVRWYFPKLDDQRVIQLGALALLRIPYLTTMLHVRKRVDFLARREPGKDEAALLDAVLVEMEGELMAALKGTDGGAEHGAGAARARGMQAPSRPVESAPDRAGSAPGLRLSSLRGQQSLVTA